MSDNTANSNSPKQHTGSIKLVWVDGRQIMQPDLEALSKGTPGSVQSYFVSKTIDDYDVISETDIKQFESLKSDEEKYDMVKGMITGVERVNNPPFHIGAYVKGDPRPQPQQEELWFGGYKGGMLRWRRLRKQSRYSSRYNKDHKMMRRILSTRIDP
jgi:hypothetical protein